MINTTAYWFKEKGAPGEIDFWPCYGYPSKGRGRAAQTVGGRQPDMMEDLSYILKGWEYDPTDERANVRTVIGADGELKVQLRVRFGVLEFCADGVPEGGGESHLDTLHRELASYRARKGSEEGFEINAMRTAQASQELMDYYQRRVCFFMLGDYRRAMRDAEHNLELMATLRKFSVDHEAAFSHDRYRAFVMMDRARAAAMLAVEQDDMDRAVGELDDAMSSITDFYKEYSQEDLIEVSKEIDVLKNLKEDLRKDYNIPLSDTEHIEALRQEQVRAIAHQEYEKAARLRDEIAELEKRLSR